MKISNLSEGMVLKNYKELCDVLEMTPAGGNKKKIFYDLIGENDE